eukprot:s4681_g5.t1
MSDVPEPDFLTALAAHFPEAGFVTKLPTARPGYEYLALVQRVHQGVSLQVTDCEKGLFRHSLDSPKLQQLRKDAGMAEFAWPTFLRLLAQALRSEDGCTTAVPADGVSNSKLCLELRFRLQSAVLLARMEMEAAATMPAVPEAQSFLQELRGFVISALGTSSGREPPAPSTVAPSWHEALLATPPRSISAPATLGQVSSPEPREALAPRPAPVKKRAPGSLVDPHGRKARKAGAKPFQLSETFSCKKLDLFPGCHALCLCQQRSYFFYVVCFPLR